jgi:disulfide bond formation protein DsbB
MTGSLNVNDLVNSLNSVKVVRCDEVQLRIAGLSLAGWNVAASAVLAVYAAVAARL